MGLASVGLVQSPNFLPNLPSRRKALPTLWTLSLTTASSTTKIPLVPPFSRPPHSSSQLHPPSATCFSTATSAPPEPKVSAYTLFLIPTPLAKRPVIIDHHISSPLLYIAGLPPPTASTHSSSRLTNIMDIRKLVRSATSLTLADGVLTESTVTRLTLAPTSLTLANGQRTRPSLPSQPCSPTQVTQLQLVGVHNDSTCQIDFIHSHLLSFVSQVITTHSLPRVKEDTRPLPQLTPNTLHTISHKLSLSSSKCSSPSNSPPPLNSPPLLPLHPVVPKPLQSAGRSAPPHLRTPLKTTRTTTCPTAQLPRDLAAPTPLSRLITLRLHSTTNRSSSTPLPPRPLRALRPPAHRPTASTTCARTAAFPTRVLPI